MNKRKACSHRYIAKLDLNDGILIALDDDPDWSIAEFQRIYGRLIVLGVNDRRRAQFVANELRKRAAENFPERFPGFEDGETLLK